MFLTSGSSYFTLAVILIMFGAASNLVRSRSGRAIMAIRDNPIAAAAMGVNTALYKTLTFGVSALYTGVAGALGALAIAFVAPDSFSFLLSISFLVGLVVGGVGSIPGCLFGGLFVLYVPNIAESISTGLAGAIYGAILLLVIFVMPAGAAGCALSRRRRRAPAHPPTVSPNDKPRGGNPMNNLTRRTILARRPGRCWRCAPIRLGPRSTAPVPAIPRSRSATCGTL